MPGPARLHRTDGEERSPDEPGIGFREVGRGSHGRSAKPVLHGPRQRAAFGAGTVGPFVPVIDLAHYSTRRSVAFQRPSGPAGSATETAKACFHGHRQASYRRQPETRFRQPHRRSRERDFTGLNVQIQPGYDRFV